MTGKYDPHSDGARGFLAIIMVSGVMLLVLSSVLGSNGSSTSEDTLHVGQGYEFTNINAALAVAKENDMIVIHPGDYHENLIIDKTVELHGTDMNKTFIHGGGSTAITIKADGCKISGLNFTGGIPEGWSGEEVWTAGMELRSDRNEIYGCYMQGNYFGILLRDSDDNWIHDCVTANNEQNGVFLSGASQNRFDSLHCFENEDSGFNFYFSPDNDLYHCRSENNGGNGWEIVDSEREYVRFSTANGNGKKGFMIRGSFDTNVIDNSQIIGNTEDGIWISTDEYPNIENCTIAENGKNGVKLSHEDYRTKARIFNNLIINNSAWAVEIEPDSGWCLIVRNDFINNGNNKVPQVFDSGDRTIFDLGMTGNYWNEWILPDADSDGIVDIPYDISGASSTIDVSPSTRRFTNHTYVSTGKVDPHHPTIVKEIPGDAIVDEMYTIYFNAVDKDTQDQDLIWGVDPTASWLTMEANILKGRPTINDVGSHTIRVWVSDGTYDDEFIFDLIVLVNPYHGENQYPPSIISGHISQAWIGEDYISSYAASDPDTRINDLAWSVTTTASFLSMEGNVLRGSPSSSDMGAFTVSILVNDSVFTDISSFTLMVHPQDTDDDIHEPDLIDIEELPRKETGEIVLGAKDLTNGKVNFVQYEWYIDGVLYGSDPDLVVSLSNGMYVILLRARAPDNDWYEVTREVNVKGIPDNRHNVDTIALVLAITLVIVIVMISIFLIFTSLKRKTQRGVPNIEDDRISERSLEREATAKQRGSYTKGPHPSLEHEYDLINKEATSWKRPSRFTMKREKMQGKLKMKYDQGEIDDHLHQELADFIDNHFPEGKN